MFRSDKAFPAAHGPAVVRGDAIAHAPAAAPDPAVVPGPAVARGPGRHPTAIIIGSGLGGLECGLILAKNGFKVTILEKAAQVGGCLQSFSRGGRLFDTGFHYVGGLGEGQPLGRLFEYFGLMDLPWCQLDPECADLVFIGSRSFPLATGRERFAERLAELFPSEREALYEYVSFLSDVGDGIFKAFGPGYPMGDLFGRSAHDYLRSTIGDPLLRKVLCGASLRMELRESLPLYVFAQSNASFMQGSWRLHGGGKAIADRLMEQLHAMGGEVLTNAEVTSIHAEGGIADDVEVNGTDRMRADWIISDAHPAVTLGLVREQDSLRKVYRERIYGLENTFGMFTANICLKPDVLDYCNYNLFVHREDADPWGRLPTGPLPSASGPVPAPGRQSGPGPVMVHFYPVAPGSKATHLDLMCPMALPEGRGEAYEEAKLRMLEECLDLASVAIPGLRGAVDRVFTSSPLTYGSFTGSPGGSAFGVRKDWRDPLSTVISPRTPLRNLLLTGQSLNLHGLLGVSMTAVLTCRQILPEDFLSL